MVFGGLIYFFWPLGFQKVATEVITERIGSGEHSRYTVVCTGFDCKEYLNTLPPLDQVSCSSSLGSLIASCCIARFEDDTGMHVHISRRGPKYTVRMYVDYRFHFNQKGLCSNPQFDPSADPASAAAQNLVPCKTLTPPADRT